jgi:hypothetical protein
LDIIAQHSAEADLTFTGMALPEGEATPEDAQRAGGLIEVVGTVVVVKSAAGSAVLSLGETEDECRWRSTKQGLWGPLFKASQQNLI